ncbi:MULTISPECIES: ABC transporter substrate-binding protein [unclassified Mesorhizobium]|uniref:ABC transporter substrate-binding protein n=1 Tax=unclassified Mesorhizobium TaxID=325217 RepID=UPI00112E393D|nr:MULTISPECIES: ABC transporter substrate-binding protein [unclassified Mesorhizobium]MBZ9983568.1 ABC transporter substrate-binding protein [Mesorhizobium sp. BR-1-1-8]TPJ48375.1 ABC transporter substrate-binding protein [Mesorhizobium sp. B2-6-4]TPK68656.1 ABC transporter substrate-binding protein [Mesorhizobium sp. B2-5-1]TPL09660.1 ABC transporter substrate-binding protein [Mesorhizobium sp. B2-4-10]TPL27432.1 ABC transporter substrate-binding protein [Mesorhizobium sp. B2-4-8]
MRKCVRVLLAGLAMVMSVTAPSLAQTLRWSSAGDVISYDPNAQVDSFTQSVQNMVFDGLVRRNKEMAIEPALATSWEIVSPTRWRFKLRQGVKFHEGQPFNADDVVATIQRQIDPGARNRENLSAVTGVEKVDDYTVDLILRGPYPLLLNDLVAIYMMSKPWMEEHNALKPGNASTGVVTYASNHANGTGAFKLVSYEPDSRSVFAVNKEWWDKPQHNLTGVEFRPIASNATRVAALLSGELDMIAPVPLQDIDRVANTAGLKVVENPSLREIFLGFSFRPELHAAPGKPNPLLNVKVRQALWHAVDLNTIQKRLMRGKSRTSGTLVAPQVTGYDQSIDVALDYDVAKAKSMLAEAGYPDGFKVGLACSNDRYIADEQICLAIASMWAKIGVEADVHVESKTTYFPRMDKGDLDIYMLGWASLPPMDGYSVLQALLATNDGNYGGSNPNGLSNAKIDELARSASTELDEAKRVDMLKAAFKITHDEALYLPLHQQPVAWAMSDKVDMPQFPDEYVRPWFAHMN